MQIVIDIDEGLYEWVHRQITDDKGWSEIQAIIMNGTPLPKGHGKLIGADKFLKDNETYTGWILDSNDWGGENAYKDTLEDLVNETQTIIEADKEV